jgi:hypothetical protein
MNNPADTTVHPLNGNKCVRCYKRDETCARDERFDGDVLCDRCHDACVDFEDRTGRSISNEHKVELERIKKINEERGFTLENGEWVMK